MRRTIALGLSVLGLLALVQIAAVPQEPAAPAPAGSAVERGRYLVEHVAQCVQCHTPRDAAGNLDRSRWLEGAEVPVQPPRWGDDWAFLAPALVGMIGYTEEEAIRLLSTGIARGGKPPLAPMPPFRLTEEDARAVYAYLTSLR